jgi:hypothetical protein
VIEQFYQFVEEREAIRRRREAGEPQPWTEDVRLRDYRFANVRRCLDPSWLWWEEHVSDLPRAFEATVVTQLVGLPTAVRLHSMFANSGWSNLAALQALQDLSFGSFMNLQRLVRIMDELRARDIEYQARGCSCLFQLTDVLARCPRIGRTTAYEIALKLGHAWGKDHDRLTWAEPTVNAVGGAAFVIEEDLSGDRAADRDLTLRVMKELLPDEWVLGDVQRSLELFYEWERPARPRKRYRC